MEALHVISQLRRPSSILYTLLNSSISDSTQPDTRLCNLFASSGEAVILTENELSFNRPRLHNMFIHFNAKPKAKDLKKNESTEPTENSADTPNGTSQQPELRLPYGKRRTMYGKIEDIKRASNGSPSHARLTKAKLLDDQVFGDDATGATTTFLPKLGDDELIDSSAVKVTSNLNKPVRSNTRKRNIDVASGIGEMEDCDFETIKIGTHKIPFDWQKACQQISNALNTVELNDIVGFNCSQNSLPMTPKNYCTHCGLDNDSKQVVENCAECGHVLRVKVDYGCLNDALIWTYIFADVGIDLLCGRKRASLEDVLRLLPLARSYQRIDELGDHTFVWQCYFVTHLIYVFSDWGQHKLSRQLFSEEFEFMISNMELVIRLDDPELVGEFLQCLKILGMEEWADSELWFVIEAGYNYLMALEQQLGGQGKWLKSNKR